MRQPIAPCSAPACTPSPEASVFAHDNRPPNAVLHTGKLAATRLIAVSSTAFWQERSALSACARNIESVSVGGNSRSRCGGNSDSTWSNNSGPVNRLKNVYASLSRACLRIRRCCHTRALGLGCIWAGSSGDGWLFRNSTLSLESSQLFSLSHQTLGPQ